MKVKLLFLIWGLTNIVISMICAMQPVVHAMSIGLSVPLMAAFFWSLSWELRPVLTLGLFHVLLGASIWVVNYIATYHSVQSRMPDYWLGIIFGLGIVVSCLLRVIFLNLKGERL